MAQLPPKIPHAMSMNWPGFGHQRSPSMGAFLPPAAAASSHPSWVDEFLDFSSAKRGAHRRSASDSIAFLEAAPMMASAEENSSSRRRRDQQEFDRLDDEQLMSMFADEAPSVPASSSGPSSPSDTNSFVEEEEEEEEKIKPAAASEKPIKSESEEAQSGCEGELAQDAPAAAASEPIVDPKRIKRILANRQSAQRSRVRKLQYISELERSVTSLQTEVSALSPRVAYLDHQRSVLSVGNNALRQRIAALAQDKIFKDAHQEALRKEIERLRQVYHQQSVKKMASAPAPPPAASASAAAEAASCQEKEEEVCA